VTTALDLSGRYYLVFKAPFPTAKIGDFDSELVEDFWQAAAANALCNLHVLLHHGRNSHHISEALFKSTARALRMAVELDPRSPGVPSTKGSL
jgi:imidazoleglycerol-phosphate dehydratase